MPVRSVIISGPPSVGKTTVAKGVSKRFGFELLTGGDILKEMARERGYSVSGEGWWDTREGMRFLEERKKNPGFDKDVDRKLRLAAERGNVTITSYTLPWLTQSGLKLWLKGSKENRAKRMAGRDGIGFDEALEAVSKRDEKNLDLYRRLYNIDFGIDLSVFDFVVNTDLFDREHLVKVCCNLLEEALRHS